MAPKAPKGGTEGVAPRWAREIPPMAGVSPVHKYEEMHTFLSCELSKFRNYLLNVAIRNFIQTDEILTFFIFPDFCVPDISKTDKVRNLKETPEVAHIIQMSPV